MFILLNIEYAYLSHKTRCRSVIKPFNKNYITLKRDVSCDILISKKCPKHIHVCNIIDLSVKNDHILPVRVLFFEAV